MKDRFRNILLATVLILCVSVLAACSGSPQTGEPGNEGHVFSDAETMLVIASERNRYRDVYTDQIWKVKVDAAGTSFDEYLLQEVKKFMTELTVMSRMAGEQGVRLTGQEKENLRQLSEAYYESMTKADRRYTGAKEKDVYQFYEQYHLANKVVEEMTKDVDLEISDSDAKVIDVQEIVVSDPETAQHILEQLGEGKTDFLSLARAASEDPVIEKTIGRNERPGSFEDTVFLLETGETSPVIEMDGRYYIVRIVKDYDEDATQERKQKLMRQRVSQAFRTKYDSYAKEHPVELEGKLWNASILQQGEDSENAALFSSYHEFMDP